MTSGNFSAEVLALEGPILVTGANGFIGAQLLSKLQAERDDCHGTARNHLGWREEAFGLRNVALTPSISDLEDLLGVLRPKTIFNLAAHGAYAFQDDVAQILKVNFETVLSIAAWAEKENSIVVQAGSSSEYGRNSAGPRENERPTPNSLYAVTKLAATNWLQHRSLDGDLKSVVLRLYSVFGPGEDESRLFPTLIRSGFKKALPNFSSPEVSRDFVYIDDVVNAFVLAANKARNEACGKIFNIGTGEKTTIREVAEIARKQFSILEEAEFGPNLRDWDLTDWYADSEQARLVLSWESAISLEEGFRKFITWKESNPTFGILEVSESELSVSSLKRFKISAVIACYKDEQAIPIMYQRLKKVFKLIDVDYEIIFVNDASPDESLSVIRELSKYDKSVIAISHSRNFGSQAAFFSGMRESTGDYVVLLDGDLQDPPELIEDFWKKATEGYEVVYGRRVERDATRFMRFAYKVFYRIFRAVAPFEIPKDAGDFSLMSRNVVGSILEMPERDLFIRAQRAYVGFSQIGVDYRRPERMFGVTTNNLPKNVGWATKGVLAVSRAPLTILSLFALCMVCLSALLILGQVLLHLFDSDIAPKGWLSLWIVILGIGSVNLLAISVVGEYVGRILEESKGRPRFVQKSITRNGETLNRTLVEGTSDA